MTPHPSNKCSDEWNNCGDIAKWGCWKYGSNCCHSCGNGEGMTPAASNTCYDKWWNCANYCGTKWEGSCKKACGKC